jgi:REP element-mobilizing transposase RayT
MPRPNRLNLEGGVYHVYNRVTRGDAVFAEEDEAELFTSVLRKVKERDEVTVFAWCLMANHFHIALRTGPVPLERTMKSLQQKISIGYNARFGTFGPLWQGRYRAKLVENQDYLDRLIFYIHLNPVASGIVNDPAQFRWSGHREIVGRSSNPIVDIDEVLLLFGATRRAARVSYVTSLKGAATEDWIGESPGRIPWWRLGRPPGRDHKVIHRDASKSFVDELGRSTGLERASLPTDEFLELGAQALRVPVARLAGRERTPQVVRARELLVTLGVERYGLRVSKIAAVLNKSPEGISRCLSRGVARRESDDEFRARLDEVDRLLSKAD